MFRSIRHHRCYLAASAFGLSFLSPAHALDFELHHFTVQEDGFAHERTFVHNDAQTRVIITPPEGWNNVGDANALTMTPPVPTGSVARIEKSPFTPALPFKDKGLESYRHAALAAVPQGATGIHVSSERDNAFPFFRWSAYEILVEYEFYGQNMVRSLLFVNMNAKEQLLLTVIAPKGGYKAIDDTAQDVLRSWQVVPNI